ncbi:hypothetical protein DFJ74DRAFT_708057 [Hyaloraphidium curvatum]|nr:hypothetical protein DFJ74DRAFT_708057 [Hyaloraphidium curvatum]
MPIDERPLSEGLTILDSGKVAFDERSVRTAEQLLFDAVVAQDFGRLHVLLGLPVIDVNPSRDGPHGRETPLILAARLDRAGCVRRLLRDPRVDPERRPGGVTAFQAAVRAGATEAALAMLRDGRADPNARMSDGSTAFLEACKRETGDVVGLLLAWRHRVDVFQRDAKGDTGYLATKSLSVRRAMQKVLSAEDLGKMTIPPEAANPPSQPRSKPTTDAIEELLKDTMSEAGWTAPGSGSRRHSTSSTRP